MNLRLSIVIPTRNRSRQCISTLQSVLDFDYRDFEIIVFDSSDDDHLKRHMINVDDIRLRYVRTSGPLNMTQCFELAAIEAQGEFVCMIGDDDGVTPALFAWAERAMAENLESVTTAERYFALYNWLDIRSPYFGDEASGRLIMRLPKDREITRIVAAETLLPEFLKGAGQGCGDMPRVYHGLVRRSLLERMRDTYGRCFDGVSPDVSFSYLAARLSKRHAITQVPITISGASAASNAGRSAMHQHKGDLWSDPHMKNYQNEIWPPTVPGFFSVETVWAQATLAALATAGSDARDFNLPRLYSLLIVRHRDRWRQIQEVMSRQGLGIRLATYFAVISVAIAETRTLLRKIVRRLTPDPKVETAYAASISEASAMIRCRLARYLP